VARNIAALGATCIFVGLVGDDEAGLTLRKALAIPELVIDKTRPTTRKVRFVSEHQTFGRQRRKQMVRVARIRENAYNVGTGSAAAIAPIIE
jgi:bifunctional ADP-heptose synthase (sugar kinase/adenylyltransferase)